MLKKIKKGVKRVMKETVIVAKSIANSLTNTRTRVNAGFAGIGIGFGIASASVFMILSAYLENGGMLYKEENCYVEEN